LALVTAVCAGIAALAAEGGGTATERTSPAGGQTAGQASEPTISDEVLDRIRAYVSDTASYDRHVANYKQFLVSFGLHDSIRQEIEKLVLEGYPLPELMIGGEYLYHSFGTVADLRSFARQRSEGAEWESIFVEYNRGRAEFKPRSFQPDYLERLMRTPALSADDIMIADRIAVATGTTFEETIDAKRTTPHWRTITAKYGILFSGDKLPRVQIKNEQMQSFRDGSGLTDARIAEAFVIAHKIGTTAEDVVGKMKEGYSPEAVFAESYGRKYR
jgi:hypothetical protein